MFTKWELSILINLVTDEITRLNGPKFTDESLLVSDLRGILHQLEDMEWE